MMPKKPVVFSGIQPSGTLHIGNYLGAIRQWVAKQAQKENYFCIVDLHAITKQQDPDELRLRTRQAAAIYLAAGLDPQLSTIFIQSHVPAHSEASWILACSTPLGWLERMTQFKVKARQRKSIGAGLLFYPLLQAADILLYDATEVPVGEDQKQHVELARDIAQRFNHLYGETFVLPRAVLPESGARIRAINDPSRKMSKSEAGERGHAINLVDSPDEIRWTIQHAVTDSGHEIIFSQAPEKAGINNLLEIYALLTSTPPEATEAHFSGRGYRELKQEVAEVVIAALSPIRTRYIQYLADPSGLDRVLAAGAQRASAVAQPKLNQIKERLGLLAPLG